MKNIKYIMFALNILFISVFHVHASCTDEEIAALKELADDIKITYKHLGKIEDDEGVYYNIFEVNVNNIPDDFYILYINETLKLVPTNGKITKNFNNGTWDFNIYSNKCEEKISEIEVFIPRFNTYSLDPLCEGVDGKDFPLCGKYYEYDVSYDNFVDRVKHYRTIHKISSNVDVDKEEKNIFQLIYEEVVKFLVNYKLYIIISIVILIISIITIILMKRRKKRGVLE